MNTDDLVLVYASQGPLGAEVARAKLAANNIEAMARYSAVGRALGLTVDGLGLVEVYVRARDATAARALLEEEDVDDGHVVDEAGRADRPPE
jgi:hypothetical protein